MTDYGGHIFIFDEHKRASMLEERALDNQKFTDAISALDWNLKEIQICAISFDGRTISFMSLVKRGRKVASYKYGVEFFNFIRLKPVPFDDITRNIGSKFTHYSIRSTSGTGRSIAPATWKEFISTLKKLRPESSDDIDRLIILCNTSKKSLDKEAFEKVAFERDAVGIALDIFKADRQEVLKTWIPSKEPAPFLKGLKESKIFEDTMIQHDARIFGDWSLLKNYVIGAIEFIRGDEKLTVLNVNRTDIEHALGVDLLYYHHKYDSYIFVQYKRMNKELTKDGNHEFVYRPIDKSYLSEITRMGQYINTNDGSSESLDLREYRLNPNAFYFKLCPKITLQPLSTDLIKGMYLPMEYWEIINVSSKCKGKKDGIIITYDNVERHLNNTLFVELVQDGWIGSRRKISSTFTNMIKSLVEDDKSVIFAYSQKVNS